MYAEYSGSPLIPDDDTQADMYLYAVENLERYGYRQYEISNFAIPGYESRHNLKYWRLGDYMQWTQPSPQRGRPLISVTALVGHSAAHLPQLTQASVA